MIIGILLGLLAGWLFFVLIKIFRFTYDNNKNQNNKNQYLLKMVIILRNQEFALEGFLRPLLLWRNKMWPLLEIIVIDDGSIDQTPKILRLLKKGVGFPVISKTPKDSQVLLNYFFVTYPPLFFITPLR